MKGELSVVIVSFVKNIGEMRVSEVEISKMGKLKFDTEINFQYNRAVNGEGICTA